MTGYENALKRIRRRAAAGALTPTERQRLSALRDQIQKCNQGLARAQAAQSVDEWQQRTQNQNGHREQAPGEPEEELIPAPTVQHKDRTGGQRRPEAWLHGVPLYREGEQA